MSERTSVPEDTKSSHIRMTSQETSERRQKERDGLQDWIQMRRCSGTTLRGSDRDCKWVCPTRRSLEPGGNAATRLCPHYHRGAARRPETAVKTGVKDRMLVGVQRRQRRAETAEERGQPEQLPCEALQVPDGALARGEDLLCQRRQTGESLAGSRRTVKHSKSICHPIHTTDGPKAHLCQLTGTRRHRNRMTMTEAHRGAEVRLRRERMSPT